MPNCEMIDYNDFDAYADMKWQCPFTTLLMDWLNFKDRFGYKKPCTILEYKGKMMNPSWEKKTTSSMKGDFEIVYQFIPPMMTEVHEEYLIFDMVGMIGSVRGTLGMCIGFSFSGVTTMILDYIQTKLI